MNIRFQPDVVAHLRFWKRAVAWEKLIFHCARSLLTSQRWPLNVFLKPSVYPETRKKHGMTVGKAVLSFSPDMLLLLFFLLGQGVIYCVSVEWETKQRNSKELLIRVVEAIGNKQQGGKGCKKHPLTPMYVQPWQLAGSSCRTGPGHWLALSGRVASRRGSNRITTPINPRELPFKDAIRPERACLQSMSPNCADKAASAHHPIRQSQESGSVVRLVMGCRPFRFTSLRYDDGVFTFCTELLST